MIIIGVTGSIGSGKSHFCKVFAKNKGVKFLSSDEQVHKIYAKDKNLFKQIAKIFPTAIVEDKIDRKILGDIVFQDVKKKKQLESIVYPILAHHRKKFISHAKRAGVKIVLLEIPLLFENGLNAECDYTVTLYCSPLIQKARVMKREGMTEEKFANILKTQMSVVQKIRLSDFAINTGNSKQFTAIAAKQLYLHLVG
jgi:dephospho-CoA kinase